MDIRKLKTDESLPHHYLIGVAMQPMKSRARGQMYLKYGPLYFHNNDVEKLRLSLMLSEDKLFPTTIRESLAIHNMDSLVSAISGMIVSSEVNQATIHHFSSKTPLDDEHFEMVVKLANTTDTGKELLNESRINK